MLDLVLKFGGGQDAHPTRVFCGTGILPVAGKMPTPQEFFVAQASCLWRKGTKLGKVE
ncbi:hypothetical protein QUA41_15935 [Microcoleus sp. Pol11C1]|uniref:hypothetical protein n=1 Tax=unclassified Microcoleus TaxID=2642155 RepID=UPI002FD33238